MQPGEVVAARLGKGATVVRVIKTTDDRVSVAIGRNKQARLPPSRIIMGAGLIVRGDVEVEALRRECEALRQGIDLSDVWEVMNDERESVAIDTLAELYWRGPVDAAHRLALALHLEETDYFAPTDEGYEVRSREEVEERIARRQREADAAEAAASVMTGLSDGRLPEPLLPDHEAVLQHLRAYAVFGDDYVRSSVAKGLLQSVPSAIGDLQQRCFELLAGAGIFSPDEPLELHRADISPEFPEDAVTEAAAVSSKAMGATPPRRDLTDLPTITIDDAETVDRDDALSVVTGPGGSAEGAAFALAIHIADAGSLIPHEGAMDREADRRMGTLYLPEGRIDMLPADVVRGAGSLDPGERRAALTVMVHLSGSGAVVKSEVFPSIVRSAGALAYEEADRALEDQESQWHRDLSTLNAAAGPLRARREAAGALNIDRPEMSVRAGDPDNVEVSIVERSSPSRQMVGELMILVNSLLAEYCFSNQVPAVYRSQEAPDLAGLTDDGPPEGPLRRFMVMRRLTPVQVGTHAAPHGALGVGAYLQATSPLRRYSDLVMQRQIGHHLSNGTPIYSLQEMDSVGQKADVQMRELGRLEEQRKRYWFLKYLKQAHLGFPDRSLLRAAVLDTRPNRHALVELEEYPFRFRVELPPAYAPGATATLRLHSVDLWRRSPSFVHMAEAG